MEVPWKCLCLGAGVSLWREPSLFGDDTHAVVARPKWAREHGIHTKCGPMCRWFTSLAYRYVLRQRRGQKGMYDPDPLCDPSRRNVNT